jgi:hypothetical protein
MAFMMTAWVLSAQLKAIASGKSPEDMSNKETYIKAALNGGTLGIYGDLVGSIFRSDNPIMAEGDFWGATLGPSAGVVSNGVQILNGLSQKNKKPAARTAIKTAKELIPFQNSVLGKWVLDKAIVDNIIEAVDPEYVRKKKRREAKEASQ